MRWLDGITNSMDLSLSKPGVGDGQGGLACCSPWGRKQSDTTERLNWTEVAQTVKHLPTCGRPGFDTWFRKIPWRREWQPSPVFLPRESHGQRSLSGYSLWGRKESDTTE